VAAGVLATGDGSTGYQYHYSNLLNRIYDTPFENGLQGSADTRFLITSMNTFSTTTAPRQYNGTDMLATNRGSAAGDSWQDDLPASDRQRRVLCFMIP
jgi:hypothetical protein